MNAELNFKAGIKDVTPTVFGYIGVGLAFGIVAHTSHLSVWIIFLMLLLVYAGSAYFVLNSMLLNGSPLAAIEGTTLLLNVTLHPTSSTEPPLYSQ